MYKIDKEKCVGCGACVQACPQAMKMEAGGKAEIIDQEKLEECGGESICPFGAIKKTEE